MCEAFFDDLLVIIIIRPRDFPESILLVDNLSKDSFITAKNSDTVRDRIYRLMYF